MSVSTPTTKIRLHGHPGSSTTNRLRMAMAVKKIPFEFVKVDIFTREHETPEFVKLNALKQIPLLQVSKETGEQPTFLKQSVAIMEYLEEVYPKPSLLPSDPQDRAAVREVAEIVNSMIQPFQNKMVVEKVAELDPSLRDFIAHVVQSHAKADHSQDDQKPPSFENVAETWPHFFIHKGFTAIESLLVESSGKFCFGNDVTMADCALLPQVVGAKFYHLDFTPYPNIEKVYGNLKEVPEIKTALGDYLV